MACNRDTLQSAEGARSQPNCAPMPSAFSWWLSLALFPFFTADEWDHRTNKHLARYGLGFPSAAISWKSYLCSLFFGAPWLTLSARLARRVGALYYSRHCSPLSNLPVVGGSFFLSSCCSFGLVFRQSQMVEFCGNIQSPEDISANSFCPPYGRSGCPY